MFDLIEKRLSAIGWMAAFTPARPTQRSEFGTSGGTMVLIRKHCEANMFRGKNSHKTKGSHGKGASWTAAIMRLKGVSIAFISLYLISGQGLSHDNLAILAEIRAFVKFW